MKGVVERVRWHAYAPRNLDGDFSPLIDDNVHLVGKTYYDHITLTCNPFYRASVGWAFEETNDPVTCLFCLAGEQRYR